MKHIENDNFLSVLLGLERLFKDEASPVHTERWQSMDIKKMPEARMMEVLHTSLSVTKLSSYYSRGVLVEDKIKNEINYNSPWAERHFEERVCGRPINPGVEWSNWPWGNKATESLDSNGMFNHNYMERYWPADGVFDYPTKTVEDIKLGELDGVRPRGLRHEYGDLEDLCELLSGEPGTRQAYLPIWFPEDTGTIHSGRKPCTLGYHFILRDGKLDVTYYIRSCDFYRHLRDDIYLTLRLADYVMNRAKELSPNCPMWNYAELGSFNMHIVSLHMFINDFNFLYRSPRKTK